MKRIQKWSALLMAVTLLFTLAAPAALAAESTVTIKTAEDLAELSRNCTLDTWSQGKTVILENDLDLHSIDFTPIPTFSGTFQGNGHTISGLTLTGSGNVRGLFRYIQNGATVQDLTVTGTIHPNGHQDDLGLLAGSNAGRILNCIASGTVMGDNRIGGLVGINETGGELVGCAFSGSVTGKHSTAGVVGENRGTLTRCSNSGSINTHDLEDDPKTDYTNLAQLNSMENVPAYTDVGGVAGYSKGTIQSCSNSGSVGYDQIGYNIGGIVGRSTGWLDGCVNTGSVSGRKDVGGIVGQLEPEVLQTFSEDFLDKLLAQLDKIDKEFKDVDYREANQRAGYVYVISNIGAFGENVYKIGMTRRLDPQDRVDELGDASVPFDFDVHAMIFSDDAPRLEAALHNAFADRKLNFVNQRREFFRVSLDEIKKVVKENYDRSVEFGRTVPRIH